jgi:Glycosyl transferase family 64 domain
MDMMMDSSNGSVVSAVVTVVTSRTTTSMSPDRQSFVRSRVRIGSIDVEKPGHTNVVSFKYQIPSPLRTSSSSSGYNFRYDLSESSYSPTNKLPRERKNSWETRGNPIQRIRVKWNAMSNRKKYWIIGFTVTVLFLSIVQLLDALYWHYDTSQPYRNHDVMFNVVMNTYKRPEQLIGGVRHYAQTCGRAYGVQHVHIVWAEEDAVPPHPSVFFNNDDGLVMDNNNNNNNIDPSSESVMFPNHHLNKVNNRAGVSFRRVPNSLNSRFLEIPGVDGPVFMVDDDIRVDCTSLLESFRAWKTNPDSMVGYYPRLAKKQNSHSNYIYQSWPSIFFHGRINMILSKACFLHSRYMKLYSSDQHPQAIRDYVDQYFNCEDVAMSMLVANITRYESSHHHRPAKPIYVEAKVTDTGLFNGISTGTGHFTHRSECLDQLTEIYRDHGWEAPLDESFHLLDDAAAWVKHIPGFWWQIRSSNLFEWAAIENVWK